MSERTVYRDISCLRDAGHDIRTTPGRGGGVRVAPGSRPRAVHFDVDEIIGLALSVAVLKATPHVPFAHSAEAALNRARRALPADRQRRLRRLEQRILVGTPATERVRSSLGTVDTALLAVFERCFTGERQLVFTYTDRQGEVSARRAECIALVLHTPVWYVLAWDLDKDASRVFRMDRISAPAVGAPLAEQHSLASVAGADIDPADDAWQRVPIG